MGRYKTIINESEGIETRVDDDGVIDIRDFRFEVTRLDSDSKFFLINTPKGQVKARLISADLSEKSFTIKVNGLKHCVLVKDRFDLLLDKMGLDSTSSNKLNQLKAPMPGLINEVSVASGDEVGKGDKLLVLEAMKMENVIKSPGQGTVSEIKVSQGDTVEKNQVLIEF